MIESWKELKESAGSENSLLTLHREYTCLWNVMEETRKDTEKQDRLASREKGDGEWSGTETFEEATDLIERGYPEGLKLVGKFKDRLDTYMGSTKIDSTPYYDVSGDSVDVAAYVVGEPEHFVSANLVEVPGTGPIIHIIIQGAAHCGIKSDVIKRKGAAVMSLIDALEEAGRSVDLTLRFTIRANYETYVEGDKKTALLTYDIPMKSAGTSLSADSIAYAVCHPSMLRRIVFSLMEHEKPGIRKSFGVGSGYGRPDDLRGECDIYVPRLTDNLFDSDEGALVWLKDKLKEFNVHEKDGEV